MNSIHILAVDGENGEAARLEKMISEIIADADVVSCNSGLEAVELSVTVGFDIAFLDTEICGTNAIRNALELQKIKSDINIIFVSETDRYKSDAIDIWASGYIMKPVTPQKIKQQLDHLRYKCLPEGITAKPDCKRVKFQTFGNFEMFVDNVPIYFSYSKTKEFIAYLVDRNGASATNAEIMAILSDEGKEIKDSYFRNLRVDLLNTLEKLGCSDIIVRGYKTIGIVKDKVECDYYDYLSGKDRTLYHGEYMQQYSWGEITNGWLAMVENK